MLTDLGIAVGTLSLIPPELGLMALASTVFMCQDSIKKLVTLEIIDAPSKSIEVLFLRKTPPEKRTIILLEKLPKIF